VEHFSYHVGVLISRQNLENNKGARYLRISGFGTIFTFSKFFCTPSFLNKLHDFIFPGSLYKYLEGKVEAILMPNKIT
jgi:hypothetical protein